MPLGSAIPCRTAETGATADRPLRAGADPQRERLNQRMVLVKLQTISRAMLLADMFPLAATYRSRRATRPIQLQLELRITFARAAFANLRCRNS